MEARHSGRPLGYWFRGAISVFIQSFLPKRSFRAARTGDGGSARLHPVSILFSIRDDCSCRRFCSVYAGQVFKQSGKGCASVCQQHSRLYENGFKFSASKTVYIHLRQQYGFFLTRTYFCEKRLLKFLKKLNFLA